MFNNIILKKKTTYLIWVSTFGNMGNKTLCMKRMSTWEHIERGQGPHCCIASWNSIIRPCGQNYPPTNLFKKLQTWTWFFFSDNKYKNKNIHFKKNNYIYLPRIPHRDQQLHIFEQGHWCHFLYYLLHVSHRSSPLSVSQFAGYNPLKTNKSLPIFKKKRKLFYYVNVFV